LPKTLTLKLGTHERNINRITLDLNRHEVTSIVGLDHSYHVKNKEFWRKLILERSLSVDLLVLKNIQSEIQKVDKKITH